MFCFLSGLFFSFQEVVFYSFPKWQLRFRAGEPHETPPRRQGFSLWDGEGSLSACGPLGLTFCPHHLTASGQSLESLVDVLSPRNANSAIPPCCLQPKWDFAGSACSPRLDDILHQASRPDQTSLSPCRPLLQGFPILCLNEHLQAGFLVLNSQPPSPPLSPAPENFPDLLCALLYVV